MHQSSTLQLITRVPVPLSKIVDHVPSLEDKQCANLRERVTADLISMNITML